MFALHLLLNIIASINNESYEDDNNNCSSYDNNDIDYEDSYNCVVYPESSQARHMFENESTSIYLNMHHEFSAIEINCVIKCLKKLL